MPRKKTVYSDQYPYHILNRSNNRERFYLPLHDLWLIFEQHLAIMVQKYQCEIILFVLMPNHYHLLLRTPKANISEAMLEFHRGISKQANQKAFRINHFFGSRYRWSLIHNELYLWNCFKYVCQNPVKAKLCERVEEYRYSTIGKSFSYVSTNYLWLEEELEWLNQPFQIEQEKAVISGIRRTEFQLAKNANGFMPHLDAPLRQKDPHTKSYQIIGWRNGW